MQYSFLMVGSEPLDLVVMNQNNLNIIRWQIDSYVLVRPGAGIVEMPAEKDGLSPNTCLALPSDRVRTTTIEVSQDEVKHLRAALPFMLEESLLEDVADLHFAYVALAEGRYAVAIVRYEEMVAWQAELPAHICSLPWLPEFLCLPWSANECVMLFEGDTVLLRWGPVEGTRIEVKLLSTLLESLDCSEHVLIAYSGREHSLSGAIPQALESRIQWRQGGWPEALLLCQLSVNLDLRQGSFLPKLPLGRWWGIWKRVALMLVVALTLKTGLAVADYRILKIENTELRTAIYETYRRVNPKGAVVDVEKQLGRQLAEYGGGSRRAAFTPALVTILQASMELERISLTSLNYSNSGSMRLNLAAPDFRSVERLRQILEKQNLTAELENSNARDDGVVARIRLEFP